MLLITKAECSQMPAFFWYSFGIVLVSFGVLLVSFGILLLSSGILLISFGILLVFFCCSFGCGLVVLWSGSGQRLDRPWTRSL
jgi:hypothetical protein